MSRQAERESCIAVQYSDSALRFTPRKNTCLFRSHPEPAICGPGSRAGPAQRQGMQSEPFQQQAAKVSGSPPAFFTPASSTLDARGLKWRTGDISFATRASFFFFFLTLNETLAYVFTPVYRILLYSSTALIRASKRVVDVFLEDAVVELARLLVDTVNFPSARRDSWLCRRVVSERWH